jgi:hypothetical protein
VKHQVGEKKKERRKEKGIKKKNEVFAQIEVGKREGNPQLPVSDIQ